VTGLPPTGTGAERASRKPNFVKLVAGPTPFFFVDRKAPVPGVPTGPIAVIVLTDTVGATFGFLMDARGSDYARPLGIGLELALSRIT